MGDYNLRYKIYSDWDFNIRCFRKGDVKITYSNIIVAHFIMGGASANYDLLFLRECILPLRMEELDTKQVGLENIKVYDEWWRLLRNANIRSLHELYKYVDKEKTPNQIKGMVIWQSKIPSTVLKMGFFSKGCMALNYFFTHRRNSS
jgi:myo-inositol catabolism protein IolC